MLEMEVRRIHRGYTRRVYKNDARRNGLVRGSWGDSAFRNQNLLTLRVDTATDQLV